MHFGHFRLGSVVHAFLGVMVPEIPWRAHLIFSPIIPFLLHEVVNFSLFQAVIPSRSMERTDLTYFCHYPLTSLFLQFDDDIIMRALIPGELGGNQVLDLRFSQLAASKSGGHTVLTMEKVIYSCRVTYRQHGLCILSMMLKMI